MKELLTIILLVLTCSVSAQTQKITGTVTDSEGASLPGVTVVVKGTTMGSITDIDGIYTLPKVSSSGTLIFSFIGMLSQEVEVNGQSKISVVMSENFVGIDEVVAIGYGTRKKANLTGAVGAIKGDELVKSPSANVISSLAGQVSGLIVNTRSGQPGAEQTEMYIRGKATLSEANTPLVLIDGVSGDLARLNPGDIESMSVLKDASAAIYGVNASNGVILVTTKRGGVSDPKLMAKGTFSFSQPTFKLDWTDSYQTAVAVNEYNVNKGRTEIYSQNDLDLFKSGEDPIGHPNQDWYALTYRDWAPQQRYSASIGGGSEKVKYYISGDIMNQESQYIKGDAVYFKQYQFRANVDVQASNNLKLSFDLFSRTKERSWELYNNHTTLAAKEALPETVVQYDNGLPGPFAYGKNPTIMGSKEVGYNAQTDSFNQLLMRFNYKMDYITEGLYADGWFKYSSNHQKKTSWFNSWFVYTYDSASDEYIPIQGGQVTTDPWLSKQFSETYSKSMHAKVGYIKTIGDHSFDGFIAMEAAEGYTEWLSGKREGYATNVIDQIGAGDESTDQNDGSASETGSLNYFGRLNYGFKDRYLIDLTYRIDGSYKFAPGYRYGYFPGISAAWRISEETFFKDNIDFMSYLKLRGSWGKMGNNNSDAFQYLATYSSTSNGIQKTYLGEDGNPVSSYYTSAYPNIALTWEVQNSTDIGLDFQLANGAIDVTTDYFYNKRKQIAITRSASLPDYYGIPLPQENLGIVNSWGIDASISYNKEVNPAFSYRVNGTFTFARNRVEYMDEASGVEEWQKKEGHSVDVVSAQEDYTSYDSSTSTRLLYVDDGLFQNQAEVDAYPHLPGTAPGDIKYIDYNGDGAISALDKVRYDKSETPEIVYGLGFSSSYKNFDLSIRLQGQHRAWRTIQPYALRTDKRFFEERWQKEGDNKYPRVFYNIGSSATGGDVNDHRSTFWLKSASFLRFKTAELGYRVPLSFCEKFKIDNIRIFVNGENLFVIDNIEISRDPELNNWGEYGISRIVSAGVNLNF